MLGILRNLDALVLEINGGNALVLKRLNSLEDAAQNRQDLDQKQIIGAACTAICIPLGTLELCTSTQ